MSAPETEITAAENPRDWAADFLRERGAIWEDLPGENRAEVLLPGPLASRLGLEFLEVPGSDLPVDHPLSPGAGFFEKALEEALTLGRSARWYLWSPLKKTLSLEDVARSATFAGVRPTGLTARAVYVPQGLFHFQVAFLCDDKREDVLAIAAHPYLERAFAAPDPFAQMVTDGNEMEIPEEPWPGARKVYAVAARAAPEMVADMAAAHQARENRRYEREVRRVRAYFAATKADLARRRTRAGLDRDRQAALQAKVLALDAEEQRKQRDLEDKHRVTAQFTLTNAAVVYAPQIRVEVSLQSRGSVEAVPLTLFWDPFLRELLLPACRVCGNPLTRVTVCPRCRRALCADDVCRCP